MREVFLDPVDAFRIDAVKRANAMQREKRLQVGLDRAVAADGTGAGIGAHWQAVDGGHVARWRVVSPGAVAMRVAIRGAGAATEVRFSGNDGAGEVYGPFTAEDIGLDEEGRFWSPVLDGDTVVVEAFFAGKSQPRLELARVSHLFVHPMDTDVVMNAKNGASDGCEVDLVCRAATDTALASVGKSVARMSFVVSGSSFLCTGTLLNPTGPQIPYFYSAAHCISTQAAANTLTTHWFYERSVCGVGSTVPNAVQVPGGATLLFANAASDVLLLKLNAAPPAGAVYAAWDSAALTVGTGLTAIHHPRGDWKKVTVGSVGALISGIEGGPSGNYIRANWSDALTEGGSSGSGIFTSVGSPVATEYRFRGGLWGGPALACDSDQSERFDFYSRFDQAFPSLAQFLNPAPVTPTHELAVTKSVSGTGTGTVTSSPAGIACGPTCAATSAAFNEGATVTLTAVADAGSLFSGWSGACSGTGACQVAMTSARSVTATFIVEPPPALTLSTTSLDFGPQLVGTTSQPQTVTLSNSGGGVVTLAALAVPPGFTLSHACTTITAGASCPARVSFAPTVAGPLAGSLTITSNVGGHAVSLGGRGEGSLVEHFYQSILRRASEPGGFAFWEAEAIRLSAFGANVNEAWFAMALSFFASPEYRAFNRTDAEFATDLYTTFFNRAPDVSGLNFWVSQMGQGLPREMTLLSFMFSPEFSSFTQARFGNTAARAEVDTVMDFYRGLLARVPDAGGLAHWVGQFRVAQCQSGGAGVYLIVEQISSAFVNGAEYAARNRTDAEFVGDLYNAFLRRGSDVAGLNFWLAQLAAGSSRDQLRQAFLSSPEFSNRAFAIANQGCMQ
ncbi:MAG TPA: DUF4214 domain-containing protein [Usitatibacter sp.]|nr:DUF4214 domain-containing protein [Usitatibacter sp.]